MKVRDLSVEARKFISATVGYYGEEGIVQLTKQFKLSRQQVRYIDKQAKEGKFGWSPTSHSS